MTKKVYEVVRDVKKVITSAAKAVVRTGGSFDEIRNNTVNGLTRRYPGLDEATLLGGFDHEYLQALNKRAC